MTSSNLHSPTRRQLLALLAGGVAVAGLGCAHRAGGGGAVDPKADAARALVDIATVPGDFLARQRLSGHMGEHKLSSEVVLQKQGDVLTLIGLTPFGTKAFALIQRGLETEYTPFVEVALPFPPEMMLADIHRTLFVRTGEDLTGDGDRRAKLGDERVDESWSGGRLMRRVYKRRRGQPKGLIIIDYGEGMSGRTPPPVITIDNQRFGYAVTIETSTYQQLS